MLLTGTKPGTLHSPRGRAAGYTLVEILVSAFVFALLGMMLVQSVSGAMRAWRTAEARRDVYERAQLVLKHVEEDIGSMFCDTRLGRATDVRLVGATDALGNSDLRFVRRIRDELSRNITRQAGERLPATVHRQTRVDPTQALLAGEGLEEVLYAMRREGGEGTLWRGVRSPIGGAGSLFGLSLERAGASPASAEDPLAANALPLVQGVLHFGVQMWDPRRTIAWEIPATGQGGPALAWDSAARAGIFPDLLRITLVLESDPLLSRGTTLAGEIASGAAEIPLVDSSRLPDPEDGEPYVLIDDEWISYERIDREAHLLKGCTRGRRGTGASDHDSGARVRHGQTFVLVLPVRASR